MHNLKILILLCFLFSFYAAQRENLRERLINKKFRVINYSTRALTDLRNRLNKGYHTLTFTEDNLSMTGICNSCRFAINRFRANSVDFGNGLCTRMYCEGSMPLEDDLTKIINNARNIELRGRFLIIRAGRRAIRAEMI
jgi:heat shock protein HslJ